MPLIMSAKALSLYPTFFSRDYMAFTAADAHQYSSDFIFRADQLDYAVLSFVHMESLHTSLTEEYIQHTIKH